MRKNSLTLTTAVSLILPLGASAATTFADWVNNDVTHLVDAYVMPFLYAILFLLFIFGMFRYFFTGGEENREKGKVFALWSIITMVAVFAVWGVVHLLLNILTF